MLFFFFFFNKGHIERSNSSKVYVCVCRFLFCRFDLGKGFACERTFDIIMIMRLLTTEFGHPEEIPCDRQDVKIQSLINLSPAVFQCCDTWVICTFKSFTF